MRYEVVPYPECADEVRAFRNANRPIQRDAAYFRWRYVDRPSPLPALIVWAIEDDGTRIGAASLIPRDFHVIDRLAPVGLVGDISVLQQARGRGVGEQMLMALRLAPAAQALAGCLVLPNEQVSGPLQRAGWSALPALPRYVRVLDPRATLRRRFGAVGAVAGGLVHGAAAPLRLLAAAQVPQGAVLHTRASFDDRYDALWQRLSKQGRTLAVRDRANLHWRFAAYPERTFRLLEIEGDGLQAYAVFHEQDDSLIVDDFLAIDTAAADRLLDGLIALVNKERLGADVHVRCDAAQGGALCERHGFRRRRDEQPVMATEGLLQAPAQWHLTAGDKDV